ncbi:pectinesterase [Musa troglodytarum]|uniref:Pectinesterase n=1 Tax=Musa troglodytarum TaxID=320322 RepID=A0A9E7KHC1_9LILI|nr:pectinesterase [Musa troglodytarum]
MATPRDKPPPKNRRLLSHGIPQWVKAADRKLIQAGLTIKPDLVVAKDGSGNYNTISEAVAASVNLRQGTSRFVIYVKAGVYSETVDITTNMQNLMMIGDGKDDTIVTGSKNFVDGTPTFNTATFSVNGDGFIAQDIGFENTAGPEKHQAVALRSSADRSVFYRCSFKGLDDLIDPAGWHAWNETMSVSNLYYAEFQSKGDRADTSKRVNWPGYHVLTTDQEAEPFTAGNFLSGDSWVLATGVPYASGLYGYDVGGNN